MKSAGPSHSALRNAWRKKLQKIRIIIVLCSGQNLIWVGIEFQSVHEHGRRKE
jgi:hypothetical protein